ncbi:MAG: sulfite exporter TauE/SafE family protein [Betaproteobacteria bacterium]
MDITVTGLTLPLTALATGFLGSAHCLGMCGGISATVALASAAGESSRLVPRSPQVAIINISARGSEAARTSLSAANSNVLAFNAGRIGSYAIAGGLAGTLGGALAGFGQGWVISDTLSARTALFVLANLMVVFTGLYLMGFPQLLAPLERAGSQLWRRISPLTRGLLPLRSPGHAAMFGMLWGWIPCGMVYAMLLTAMSSGGTASGMATMLAFGAGTLPAMLLSGWAAGSLQRWTRLPRVRVAAGLVIVMLGVFGLARVSSLEQLQAFGAFCNGLLQSNASVTP